MAPPCPVLIAVVSIALPALLATTLGPLLGVAHDPNPNVKRLHVVAANFDSNATGSIGKAFLEGMNATIDRLGMPKLEIILDSSNTSPENLAKRVDSGEIYAAMWVNKGKDDELHNAITRMVVSKPGTATSYNGTGAITLCWDEGRNPLITTARVGSPLKAALNAFSAAFAPRLVANLPAAVLAAVAKSSRPDLLTSPVGWTEKNLHISTLPLAGNALTVGNILMIVFALVIATAALEGLAKNPWVSGLSPARRALVLLAAMTWWASCVAAMYAILVVCIASPGEWTTGSIGWAQVWATQWLHIMCFVPYLAAFGELVVPDKMGVLLMPFIIFNSIGGWNIDVADPGYIFFAYTPFFHACGLLRYAMYGSLKSWLPTFAGVLCGWAVWGAIIFMVASIRVTTKKRIEAQKQAEVKNESRGNA